MDFRSGSHGLCHYSFPGRASQPLPVSHSEQVSTLAISFPLDFYAKEARIESVAEFISFFIFNSLGIEDMTLEQVWYFFHRDLCVRDEHDPKNTLKIFPTTRSQIYTSEVLDKNAWSEGSWESLHLRSASLTSHELCFKQFISFWIFPFIFTL